MRLFLAIAIPDKISQQLLLFQHGVAGVRWLAASQMHLTLCFIGDTLDEHQVDELVSPIDFDPFELRLSQGGYFSRKGSIHTLYVGVEHNEELLRLYHAIAVRIGRYVDLSRTFKPHVTIGRSSRGAEPGAVAQFVAGLSTWHSLEYTVNQFDLYESILSDQGAQYRIVARYRSPFSE